ncbi:MAG: hypothetical protein JWP58_2070 [Hymenobacter sp.]|nr:hypothetical protein [Hymenobacter sp.]
MARRISTERNTAATKLTLRNQSAATGLWQVVCLYSFEEKVKKFLTGYNVRQADWNKAKGEILAGGVDDVKKANAHLREVKSNLDGIINRYIQQHGHKPSLTQLEAEYNLLQAPEEEVAAIVTTPVIEALAAYIEVRRPELSPNSIKAYTALRQNLRDYKTKKRIEWALETLTTTQIENFQDWLLTAKGFHNTTVERRIISLKKFLEFRAKDTSVDYKALRPKYKVKEARNEIIVTLTKDELTQLEALPLPENGHLDRVRKLFILQCWTGLRFGDVIRLTQNHVHGDTVQIDIDKTQDYSSIPLFPAARKILATDSGVDLALTNQVYNRSVKDLCAMLPSMQTTITKFYVSKADKKTVTKPKFNWITSHTARRTFISLAIESGIQQHFVMKWSNHVDVRSFRKYQNKFHGEDVAAQKFIEAMS